jgi:hypothetical protein
MLIYRISGLSESFFTMGSANHRELEKTFYMSFNIAYYMLL